MGSKTKTFLYGFASGVLFFYVVYVFSTIIFGCGPYGSDDITCSVIRAVPNIGGIVIVESVGGVIEPLIEALFPNFHVSRNIPFYLLVPIGDGIIFGTIFLLVRYFYLKFDKTGSRVGRGLRSWWGKNRV